MLLKHLPVGAGDKIRDGKFDEKDKVGTTAYAVVPMVLV